MWSYSSWIYNYLCNQYLSPLTWVWIPPGWGVLDTTLCDKVCQWLAAGQWFSQNTLASSTNKNLPPRYNWNIVESGIKHYNPTSLYPWLIFLEKFSSIQQLKHEKTQKHKFIAHSHYKQYTTLYYKYLNKFMILIKQSIIIIIFINPVFILIVYFHDNYLQYCSSRSFLLLSWTLFSS